MPRRNLFPSNTLVNIKYQGRLGKAGLERHYYFVQRQVNHPVLSFSVNVLIAEVHFSLTLGTMVLPLAFLLCQVFDLRSICVSFGHPLAMTCDEFCWLWLSSTEFVHKSTQVFTVWPPSASRRHQLVASQLYVRGITAFAACVNLRDSRIRLATLRKSVRKFWFCKLASTCVDVRVRLARA